MTREVKTVAVFGAAGRQGRPVVQSLSQNPDFRVRAITGLPTSQNAKGLSSLGVEVLQTDGLDKDGLCRAFSNAWAAFVDTSPEDPEAAPPGIAEEDLAGTVLECAARCGVQHLVYSSGIAVSELTNGAVSIPFLELKVQIERLAYSSQGFKSVTPIVASWYMEHLLDTPYGDLFGGFPHFADAEGYLTYKTPFWGGREDVPWISTADDFGDLVHGILLNPLRWNRRLVQGTSDIVSSAELVNAFVSVTGQRARYAPLTDPFDMKTQGEFWREQERELFRFAQLREGEYFPNGPTEIGTAAALKRAAFKAKGGRGRETLMTVREFIEREFGRS
ncbi:NmrA-like family protein [Penicillium hispanicum]|uniref:NmrA-like family protein n=1 Tax=Penicillium hispanicum TaxID=1080232 RepID=UPI0025409384|nr:NmrA-like family protein [Penicillium hispanicum]KAJ5587438.1 NmrA-like family protein [Penicillium hispanicum]